MLSVKQGGNKYHFWIFSITWPVIGPLSPLPLATHSTLILPSCPWPLVNTLPLFYHCLYGYWQTLHPYSTFVSMAIGKHSTLILPLSQWPLVNTLPSFYLCFHGHWQTLYPWCNCYRRRKWTRRHEFKSWTKLIAFHIALIPLGKVWIQLFSFQLWVNSWAD